LAPGAYALDELQVSLMRVSRLMASPHFGSASHRLNRRFP
jgi:hypothetical protein